MILYLFRALLIFKPPLLQITISCKEIFSKGQGLDKKSRRTRHSQTTLMFFMDCVCLTANTFEHGNSFAEKRPNNRTHVGNSCFKYFLEYLGFTLWKLTYLWRWLIPISFKPSSDAGTFFSLNRSIPVHLNTLSNIA